MTVIGEKRAAAPDVSHSLDSSLVRGLAWTGVVKWFTQLLRWAATLGIARLLTPDDYGLVGMAMVYVSLVQLFGEFGLTSAIIRDRGLDEGQIAGLGGLSLVLAFVLVTVSVVLAFPLSLFFGEPAVRLIIIALSIRFLIDSVALVPKALLARDLQFGKLAILEGVESVTLAVVTLSAAFVYRSYWALVIGVIASALLPMLVAVVWRPYRITWPVEWQRLLAPVRFGRDMVVSTLAWYGYSNADFIVVGRVLSKTALGAYTVAWNVASVPVEKISTMINRVALPVLSAVQDDVAEMRRYFVGLSEGIALLSLPTSVGLALVSDDFVLALLGERWYEAILPLRFLALYAGVRSLMTLPPLVMVARGHAAVARNFSLVTLLVLPIAFLIGTRWGTAGVAGAWLLAYPLCVVPMNLRYTFRLLELPLREFVDVLWPYIAGTVVMAACVVGLTYVVPPTLPSGLKLLVEVTVGAAVYALYVMAFHRARVMRFIHIARTVRQS